MGQLPDCDRLYSIDCFNSIRNTYRTKGSSFATCFQVNVLALISSGKLKGVPRKGKIQSRGTLSTEQRLGATLRLSRLGLMCLLEFLSLKFPEIETSVRIGVFQ